ncbi:hypothetical protein MesoLjLc_17920 [Mesorhizobium sp. L-8-10]|nr:hypothetical protein MesoLjLc_17920 [Mesorhizobium sp. L-8-10]
MARKDPAFRADDGKWPATDLTGLKPPGHLHHLNITTRASYDDAAFVEGCVGITSNRCLIIADGFYEFTDPAVTKKKRKDKWQFTKTDEPIFAIAGIWRDTKEVGEAFTMLTMEPGPDIAPYHDRQIVILERGAWSDWLDSSVPTQSLITPLPAGSLQVEQVG